MRISGGILVSGAMVLGLSSTFRSARAEGSADAAAAQALYDRATELMDNDHVSEACPKLEEVTRLVPDGLGARMTLAECYEREGKLASAWAQYSSTANTAARTGQLARQERASQKAASLWPRLATITVEVPASASGLEGFTIRRDGSILSSAQWGERIPVDKGDHVIEVETAGSKRWRRELHISRDGASATVAVDTNGGEGADPGAPSRSWQKPLAYTTGAVGIAALGVGFALGGVALSKASASKNECDANLVCSQQGLDMRREGKSFGNAATALIVIGAASTAAGIILLVSAPSSHRTEVAVSPGYLSVRGRF